MLTFFFFRVVILSYVVFTKTVFSIPGFVSYDMTSSLNRIELAFFRLNQVLYVGFYLLNVFWFWMILKGLLQAVGIIAKPMKGLVK